MLRLMTDSAFIVKISVDYLEIILYDKLIKAKQKVKAVKL
jgi:hypothetical protein